MQNFTLISMYCGISSYIPGQGHANLTIFVILSLAAVAMAMSVSVCHKSEFCQNDWMD